MSDTQFVLTEKQVCRQLNVSRATLWRWRRSGKIASYKLGAKKIGYSPTHIAALLKQCEWRESVSAQAA
jgi:excisionase family DNA binding protein